MLAWVRLGIKLVTYDDELLRKDMSELARTENARTQYHWAIANIGIAAQCVIAATGAFTFGYPVAGVLTLTVSVAAVINSGLHRKRGDTFAQNMRENIT